MLVCLLVRWIAERRSVGTLTNSDPRRSWNSVYVVSNIFSPSVFVCLSWLSRWKWLSVEVSERVWGEGELISTTDYREEKELIFNLKYNWRETLSHIWPQHDGDGNRHTQEYLSQETTFSPTSLQNTTLRLDPTVQSSVNEPLHPRTAQETRTRRGNSTLSCHNIVQVDYSFVSFVRLTRQWIVCQSRWGWDAWIRGASHSYVQPFRNTR